MFNILCLLFFAPSIFGISVDEAIRFDKEIRTIEDYKQYLASVRKIYLKQTARRKVTTAGSSLSERDGFGFGFHLDFNTFMVQGSGSELARPAACIPELTIVPIELSDTDSSDLLIPSCTRVERCGGCCSHHLLSCQPLESEHVTVSVLVLDTINMIDKIVETNLTRHLSCGCQCQVQEHHCHNLQKYHPEECRCECINWSDRTLCLQQSERVWDDSSCSCQCRDQDVLCPTGMMFSEISCGCEYFDVSNTAESKPRHGRPYTKRKIKT